MKLKTELVEHERVLTATRMHPKALAGAGLYVLLAIVLASFASTVKPASLVLATVVFIVAAVALYKAAERWVHWLCRQYFLTNYRLILMDAGQMQASLPLDRIRGMNVQMHRLKGAGDIVVDALGTTHRVECVPVPQKFSRLTQSAQQKFLSRA